MGFVIDKLKRDKELPKFRKHIQNTLEQDLLEDVDVLGVFYGGSIGSDETDLYSDIDLRIVVKRGKLNEFIEHKKERPANWGTVLFFEDVNPNSRYTVVHFDCFVKLDCFYYEPEDIQPSVWLQQIKIVKDTNGFLADVFEKSRRLAYQPTVDEFELWRTKFFAHFHEAYRRMMRGEYYYSLSSIDFLRLAMVHGWYMEAGNQPNALGDWAKYEGARSKLSEEQKMLLEQWHSKRDPSEMLHVMRNIAYEFKELHRSLCMKLGIEEKEEWIQKILQLVF